MDGTRNIILGKVTQSQNITHGMHSLISALLAQMLRTPKIQFTDHMKLRKKEDQSVDALVLLRRRNKILMGTNMKTKCGA